MAGGRGKVGEVLYETQYHAAWSSSSSHQALLEQANKASEGGLFSRLSLRGLRQLKEKWSGNKLPRSLNRKMSLFISANGEHVGVAANNRITVLQKDDNYMNPCGIFISNHKQSIFAHGAWSEPQGILGVVDQMDRVFFIKSNGEEITSTTASQLKLSAPIVDLIVLDDLNAKKSCLCGFCIVTADGLLHHIEVTQDPSSGIFSIPVLNSQLISRRQLTPSVVCLDYHPGLSLIVLLAVVGISTSYPRESGHYSLSLWRITNNNELESVFCSSQVEGLFSMPKDYGGSLTIPKVIISPKGSYVSTLDLTGCVNIFSLKCQPYCLSFISFDKRNSSQAVGVESEARELLSDVADVSWWSDHIVIIAKKSGVVTMFDVCGGMKALENDLLLHAPVLGRVMCYEGYTFVLEDGLSKGRNPVLSQRKESVETWNVVEGTSDNHGHLSADKCCWSLMSFVERSISEIYNILINSQQYQDALDFANCHGLEKDEVFKSQWLHSDQGIYEINTCLPNIKDQMFVLSECVNKGPTEDAVRALLSYGLFITDQYRFLNLEDDQNSPVWNFRKMRLKLLQCRDRLETFLGINMGSAGVQKFRSAPLHASGISLAESGKIGALNLLFKRHPYSLAVNVLEILSAIPETIHVGSYGQLLPGKSPPTTVAIRDEDWIECERMASFLLTYQVILKHCMGFVWPQMTELSEWYKNRARNIDSFSGQLDNSLSLVDLGFRKGIVDLQRFHEDMSYLHQLVYSTDEETTTSMSLFEVMLMGTKAETVVKRLREIALPFMRNRTNSGSHLPQIVDTQDGASFLVRWLKKKASENNMDICLVVIEEGCKDLQTGGFFRDEIEAMEVTIDCIYLCTLTDQWNTLASMLSKLQYKNQKEKFPLSDKDFAPKHITRDSEGHVEEPSVDIIEKLRKRAKITEGHVEVGRLLAYYQVPKPMSFFLGAHSDEKNIKQLLRLIISDNDWANMWRDMQCFQEKAFHYLDLEYMLMEFCRGLLKLRRQKTLSFRLPENIFFSIWKARECLSLFPNSDSVKAEADVIDALTIKLPSLGVKLLPMQFKQVRNPMEIINMVIRSQTGAYLNVDELIEIAQLLGLSSQDDISSIQEAVAREAVVTGDLQIAFDLCLILSKKGHGPIWDLCAAVARGPALDNMDINARRQLNRSVNCCTHGKKIDMQIHCEKLMALTGTSPPNISIQGSPFVSASGITDVGGRIATAELVDGAAFHGGDEYHQHSENIKNILSTLTKEMQTESGSTVPRILRENGKFLSFAAVNLPWLFELSKQVEYSKNSTIGDNSLSESWCMSVGMQAVLCILSWLAMNEITPKDDLIASLAKSVMETSTSEEGDIIGCSFLLNLMDAFRGAEIIEEQIATRKGYRELSSIMNLGRAYSSLQIAAVGCSDPEQRKILLAHKFQEKHASFSSGEMDNVDKAQSTFWKAWKLKLEEQKELADRGRQIEQLIPGVQTGYFSFIDSVKLEKRHILKSTIELADAYGVQRTKVLLRYLGCALVSEHLTNDEILAEVLDYKEDVVASAKGVISVISSIVYPQVDGRNKHRLSYVYGVLRDCCRHLKQTEEQAPMMREYSEHPHTLDISQFLKLLEQECKRVSFIKELNFKNIAGLVDLDFEHFNAEVCSHISDSSVTALAEMVRSLVDVYIDSQDRGLMSWQSVYKCHVLNQQEALQARSQHCSDVTGSQEFFNDVEASYDSCRIYIRELPREDILYIIGMYCMLFLSHDHFDSLSDESASKHFLVSLLNFWIKSAKDIKELITSGVPDQERLSTCLQALKRLVAADEVQQIKPGGPFHSETSHLYRAMAFAGCHFEAIGETFLGQESSSSDPVEEISQLYISTIDSILSQLGSNSDDVRSALEIGGFQWGQAAGVGKLVDFSDDLQMPSQIRVFSLQMMEAGWDGSLYAEPDETHDQGDGRSRFTSSLVALKSTQLFSSVSPVTEITPEDIKTLDSAVSCFSRLLEMVTSETHLNKLQAILEEWEGFFFDGRSAQRSNCVGDDWDEGWEDLPEELTLEETESAASSSSLNPLHSCWMLIMRRLVGLSRLRGVIELIDRSLAKPHGVLLSEDEAQSLLQLIVERDCFMGLKMALLLPYRALWFQSLSMIEDKLKQEDPSKKGSDDEELLSLVLSSGILPSIAADRSYERAFAYFCCSAGLLSRTCQEAMLRERKERRARARENTFSLFGRFLFPFFISELAKAGQLLLAGFMVSQWMHTHPSFSLVGTVEVSLRKYLEAQSQSLSQLSDSDLRDLGSCKSLTFTVSSLGAKLGHSIRSTLSALSSDIQRN
ncbi:unnamed protein product [Spirodela intermedia]|uniref:Sec39 domain-containing protein n=1 Tax=Spirodela intermedia TaxID=51605 RepID=A0A7I8IGD2_SPIIN|nr:unnamed protein product [Spirodela intermedia]CAA6656354.1 unnamed protein product [Spirodela intermedia]